MLATISSKLKKILAIFFVLLSVSSVFGLNPDHSMNRFNIECFDSSNGMPQNTVADIFQDKDGYMYFATQEGVTRYDGVDFRNIQTQAASNNTSSIVSVSQDNLLLGTAAGVYSTKDEESILSDYFVRHMIRMPNGDLWVATYSSGIILFKANGKKDVFTKETEKINSNIISKLAVDSKGNIIAATLEGISIFKKDHFEPVEGIYAFSYDLSKDDKGWIWAATDRGLALIKDGKLDYIYKKEDGLPTEKLRSVVSDSQKAVWIGTETGDIIRFYKGKFSMMPRKANKKLGAVINVFEDRENNIWFGTEVTGTCIVREGTLFQPGINTGNIRSITQKKDGSIWTATFGEGIKVLTKKGLMIYDTSNGLRTNSINTVFADSQDRVWIGARRSGVQVHIDGKIADFASMIDNFSVANPVSPTMFFEDSRGNIWIADRHSNKPVYVWKDGVLESYTIMKGELSVLDIAENSKGEIFLATIKSGIFKFDSFKKVFERISALDGLKASSLFIDKNDRIWVTTFSEGIIVLANGDPVKFNEQKGLYSNTVHDIIQDNNESLWFSTNRGVFTISFKDMDEFISGKKTTVPYRLFKEEDGMVAGECNGGSQPSMLKASDGTIWVPTITGVATIDPDRLEVLIEIPPVKITGAILDNVKNVDLKGQKGIEIPPGTRSVEFFYTSLFFSHPEKVEFEYKLEGFEDTWNKAGKRRNATYTNISPGTYRFLVKAFLSDSPKNSSSGTIAAEFTPFFYQDQRFRAFVAALLLLIILAAYNMKIRIHKMREKELTEIVSKRTEELVKANEKLRESILKDPMTGLCNRRYLFEIEQPRFERKLFMERKDKEPQDNEAIKVPQPEDKVTGLFLIDINKLKKVNEKFGYDFGDRLLVKFSEALKESVRKDDLVVRWGGDEFLVILNNTNYSHLSNYANKVVDIATAGIEVHEKNVKLELSIGYASMPFYSGAGTLNFEENLLMADMALFKALSDSKDKVKQAIPGSKIPDKDQIAKFMKDIDEGIEQDFFNIINV